MTTKPSSYSKELPDGLLLTATVSACVFMYPGYPLQLTVQLRTPSRQDLGTALVVDRSKTATTFTEADIQRLLDQVAIQRCRYCTAMPAYDPKTVETNRDGKCEACFTAELDAELRLELALEEHQLAAKDKRMKQSGKPFRVTAWVHDSCGGDDFEIHWYFATRPSSSRVQALLRQEGSEVTNDFQIIAL